MLDRVTKIDGPVDDAPAPNGPKRVCFFLNAQPHHLMHTVPIAIGLSRDPRFAVHVIAATTAHLDQARALAAGSDTGTIRFEQVGGRWLESLTRLTGVSIPPKLLTLAIASRRLADFDAVVLPERTSLLLRRMGLNHLRFVHTAHGAGDRAVGYDARIRRFDFALLAGEKQRRRMLATGLIREGSYAVVGYPKFDAVAMLGKPAPLPFDNGRPVVLYNPHCDRRLSSWPVMGETILRQFAAECRYNLIVAPHLKYFDRRRERARIERLAKAYAGCANIHFDFGSRSSIDMGYTVAADVYLGDVSSQVYEFLTSPRPCVFLNSHGAAWQNDENYAHWRYGPVLDNPDGLLDAIDAARVGHAAFLAVQQQGFRDTVDLGEVPSFLRAARALSDFLLPQAPSSASVMSPAHG